MHLHHALLQGQMEEYLTRQVSGHKNWKATITPKVRCWFVPLGVVA